MIIVPFDTPAELADDLIPRVRAEHPDWADDVVENASHAIAEVIFIAVREGVTEEELVETVHQAFAIMRADKPYNDARRRQREKAAIRSMLRVITNPDHEGR